MPPTRIPSVTDGERRECDGDACIRASYMTRERTGHRDEEKESCEGSVRRVAFGSSYTRLKERRRCTYTYTLTQPPRRHSRAARLGTHARTHASRSYEAKRRERYALPIFMPTDTDAKILRIFNYDRTKSLHASERVGA